jgi:hypothetical protein
MAFLLRGMHDDLKAVLYCGYKENLHDTHRAIIQLLLCAIQQQPLLNIFLQSNSPQLPY